MPTAPSRYSLTSCGATVSARARNRRGAHASVSVSYACPRRSLVRVLPQATSTAAREEERSEAHDDPGGSSVGWQAWSAVSASASSWLATWLWPPVRPDPGALGGGEGHARDAARRRGRRPSGAGRSTSFEMITDPSVSTTSGTEAVSAVAVLGEVTSSGLAVIKPASQRGTFARRGSDATVPRRVVSRLDRGTGCGTRGDARGWGRYRNS
jgi:hypothetical protein